MRSCAKCGNPLSDGAGFCTSCGSQSTSAPTVSPSGGPVSRVLLGVGSLWLIAKVLDVSSSGGGLDLARSLDFTHPSLLGVAGLISWVAYFRIRQKESANVAGTAAYLGWFLTGIVFLVIRPWNKDPFVRFHAFESIFMSVSFLVGNMLVGMVYYRAIPVVQLVFVLLSLFSMYKAYKGERVSLPLIGRLTAELAVSGTLSASTGRDPFGAPAQETLTDAGTKAQGPVETKPALLGLSCPSCSTTDIHRPFGWSISGWKIVGGCVPAVILVFQLMDAAKTRAMREILLRPEMFILTPNSDQIRHELSEQVGPARDAAAAPFYPLIVLIVVVAVGTVLAMFLGNKFGKNKCNACGHRWRVGASSAAHS